MTRKALQSDAPDEGASITDTQILRVQIEQTRAEMGETLEAIKEKLNPQTMINQAKETVSEVTADAAHQAQETIHTVVADVTQQAKETVSEVTADAVQQARETVHAVVIDVTEQAKETARGAGREAVSGAVAEAKEAVGSAVHTAKDRVADAADTAKEAGSSVVDVIKRNPIPAALIGLGVGWLFMSNRNQNPAPRYERRPYRYDDYDERERYSTRSYERYEPAPRTESRFGEVAGEVRDAAGEVKDRVKDAAGEVKDRAGELGHQAARKAEGAWDGLQRTFYRYPLPMAALALGIGATVGLLTPDTQTENRILGETRDELADKAQRGAQELATKVQTVVEESLDTLKQEARHQGLTTS